MSSVSAASLLDDEPSVQVKRVVKIAPCGGCGNFLLRDKMWAMNTKIYSPDDKAETVIRVRVCETCATGEIDDLREIEWDNASMRVLKDDESLEEINKALDNVIEG